MRPAANIKDLFLGVACKHTSLTSYTAASCSLSDHLINSRGLTDCLFRVIALHQGGFYESKDRLSSFSFLYILPLHFANSVTKSLSIQDVLEGGLFSIAKRSEGVGFDGDDQVVKDQTA